MTTPTVFDLRNDQDAARFDLTRAQRDKFLTGCFRNRSGARPRAIFCHVQEGTTRNSLNWSINKPGSLNSYTVTAQKDGSILRCIPEEHGPWTNGAVRKPKAAAQKLLALGGNPNIYTLSIEAEGTSGGAHPTIQIDAIYWQIRQWQAKYRIPNAWVFEHADVDTVERSNCAGWYYDEIRARLAADGEVAPATVHDQASGVTFFWVGDRVRAVRDTPRFRFADESQTLGPDLRKGEEFDVDFLFAFGEGGQLWYYTPAATRVKAADTERISDRKAA